MRFLKHPPARTVIPKCPHCHGYEARLRYVHNCHNHNHLVAAVCADCHSEYDIYANGQIRLRSPQEHFHPIPVEEYAP